MSASMTETTTTGTKMNLRTMIAHIRPHPIEGGHTLIETILTQKNVEVGAEAGDEPLLMNDPRVGEDQARRL